MMSQYFYDANVDITSFKPHNTDKFLDALHFFIPGRNVINDRFKKQIISRLIELYEIEPKNKEAIDVLEKHYETIGTILVQTSKYILNASNNTYQDLLTMAFANNLHINFTALPQDRFKSVLIEKHITNVKHYNDGTTVVNTDSADMESDLIHDNYAFSHKFNKNASKTFTKHLEFLKEFKRIVDSYARYSEGILDNLYPPIISNELMFGDANVHYIEDIIEYHFNQEACEILSNDERNIYKNIIDNHSKYLEDDSTLSDTFKHLFVLRDFLKEEYSLDEPVEEEDMNAFDERVNAALNAIKPFVTDHHIIINALINERTSVSEDLYEVLMLKPILNRICNDAHIQLIPQTEKLVHALLKVLFYIEVIPKSRECNDKSGFYTDSSATRLLTDSIADLIELLSDDDHFADNKCPYNALIYEKKQVVIEMLMKYMVILSTTFIGIKENRYVDESYSKEIDDVIACLTRIDELQSKLIMMNRPMRTARVAILNKIHDYGKTGVKKKPNLSANLAAYRDSIHKLDDTYAELRMEISNLVKLNPVIAKAEQLYKPLQNDSSNLNLPSTTTLVFKKELSELCKLDAVSYKQQTFFGSEKGWLFSSNTYDAIQQQCYNLWCELTNAFLSNIAINKQYDVRLSQADVTIAHNCKLSIGVSDNDGFNNILLDVPVDGKIMHIGYKCKQTKADLESFQVGDVAFQNFIDIGFDDIPKVDRTGLYNFSRGNAK